MILDVLIPTNGQLSKLQPLLASIGKQSLRPDRIVLLLHKQTNKDEVDLLYYFLRRELPEGLQSKLLILSHLSSDYEPGHRRGYDRNYLLSHAKAKFVCMIDHDNQFGPELFTELADWYVQLKEELQTDLLLSPTILWRDTQEVQSQGITQFSYLFPKYQFAQMSTEDWQEVQMIGGNSLFGPRELFQQIRFDERFKRSYEDIDFTYRVSQAGFPVIVLNKVEIHHMEPKKNKLEQRLMGDEKHAYERARNRIWFVKKNATLRQKIQYFGIGCWLQTIWFLWICLRFGGENWRKLLRAVWLGTIHGLLEDKEEV